MLQLVLVSFVSISQEISQGAPAAEIDARTLYDVQSYDLALVVDPGAREVSGTVTMQVRVVCNELDELVLDLTSRAEVEATRLAWNALPASERGKGRAVPFALADDRLSCRIEPRPARRDETLALAITYRVQPGVSDRYFGFHWDESPSGTPWISTFSAPIGCHNWWPCKAAFFHPEDKADRIALDVTVPDGLIAVSNGRLLGESGPQEIRSPRATDPAQRWRTFHWSFEYPIPTFAVALCVGAFVETSREIELPEVAGLVPFQYWVLPESNAAAAVQFAEVPEILAVYTRYFGPFPFPNAKVGLAQVSFPGMGHASLISYGSNFPAWCEKNGDEDARRPRHRDYDRTLVHELAHEWWGNAVSARDWGEMWLHEGFATYAEGVWVEATRGREEADRFFEHMARNLRKGARLIRGTGLTAREGYSLSLYDRGAVVLHTLRHVLDDDAAWWTSLRTFQERFRYKCASSADFRAVVEECSGRDLAQFFEEWVKGSGTPSLVGSVSSPPGWIAVEVTSVNDGEQAFHAPLDITWRDATGENRERVELAPGENHLRVPADGEVSDLSVVNLSRLPGRHKIHIE
jgi:aminopeptidase N